MRLEDRPVSYPVPLFGHFQCANVRQFGPGSRRTASSFELFEPIYRRCLDLALHGQPLVLVTGQGNSAGALGMDAATAGAWRDAGVLLLACEMKSEGFEVRGCKDN